MHSPKQHGQLNILLYLLFAGLFLLLLGQQLFQYGMFVDGVFYSNIARDFAQQGSHPWKLEITQGVAKGYFYSHPPLAFWLQSSLFSLFGDVFWVDRAYSLLCFGASVLFSLKIMQLLRPNSHLGQWVLIFYLLVPQVSWIYTNNLLENTLNVFCLLAIYGHLQVMLRQTWAWGLIAIAASLAAILAKGPVGLFPLAVPLLVQLSMRPMRWGSALGYWALYLLGFLACGTLLWYSAEGAADYFSAYLNNQLQPSLLGQLEIASHRGVILIELAQQLLPMAVLGGLLYWWKPAPKNTQKYRKEALLFLGIGLSASLPIIISPKQMGFYILPSLIYFVMSFVFFCAPQLKIIGQLIIQSKRLYWAILTLTILSVSIGLLLTVLNFGTYHRDQQKLKDIQALSKHVQPFEQLAVSKALYSDWILFAYLYRQYKARIALSPGSTRCFIVKHGNAAPEIYSEKIVNGEVYDFYCKKKATKPES